jgi:hypothetical protein
MGRPGLNLEVSAPLSFLRSAAMKFVEISGATLLQLANEDEIPGLRASGVTDKCKIRINPQGDIEVFQHGSWAIIGGLLGDYANRIRRVTGQDWS